jgi:predicted kinase
MYIIKKDLFLLRGLPGAGKTSLANSIGGIHYEADMYFTRDGEYKFDPAKLPSAHGWCLGRTEAAMIAEESKIVVSNTFTQEWEMKKYYDLAELHGYRVFSLVVENRHGGVNEHNVPEDKLDAMRKRFQISL